MEDCYILVAGGRDYDDQEQLFSVLDQMKKTADSIGKHIKIVNGGARGADTLSTTWYKERMKENALIFKPEYDKYPGKIAPFKRNEKMAEFLKIKIKEGYIAFAVIFPGGNGTRHMKETCRKNYIKVKEVDSN